MLNNILFVSEQTLKQNSKINLNVDNKLLTQSIKDCMYDNILPILGTGLFNELQLQISANTVTQLNTTLLNEYIIPALTKYVESDSLSDIHMQIRNGSISKSVGDTFQAIELKELQYLIDRTLNKAESRAQRLIDYLVANAASYPLYNNPGTSYDTIHPNQNNAFSTGMVIPGKRKINYNCRNCPE